MVYLSLSTGTNIHTIADLRKEWGNFFYADYQCFMNYFENNFGGGGKKASFFGNLGLKLDFFQGYKDVLAFLFDKFFVVVERKSTDMPVF